MLSIGAVGVGLYGMRGEARHPNPGTEAELAARRLPARYRSDTVGYSSYLRGLTLRFQNHLIESRDTLAALVDREPLYVPGLHGLANAWILTALGELTDPNEAWSKADALARRALDLDSTAASAWLALAAEDFHIHVICRAPANGSIMHGKSIRQIPRWRRFDPCGFETMARWTARSSRLGLRTASIR